MKSDCEMDKESLKNNFLENLRATGGIIYQACEKTGINRSAYYRWMDSDPEFAVAVEEVKEAQIDFVESKLMQLINAGDTTATIFYLKTMGRKRGYNEKLQLQPVLPEPKTAPVLLPPGDVIDTTMAKRICNKSNTIKKILKKQGKFTPELVIQVDIAAQLLVRAEILRDEIFDANHKAVNVEISREGNERESISPKEKLYMDLLQLSQKALRALGMNTDSRERKPDNDGFNDFMQSLKDDSEE